MGGRYTSLDHSNSVSPSIICRSGVPLFPFVMDFFFASKGGTTISCCVVFDGDHPSRSGATRYGSPIFLPRPPSFSAGSPPRAVIPSPKIPMPVFFCRSNTSADWRELFLFFFFLASYLLPPPRKYFVFFIARTEGGYSPIMELPSASFCKILFPKSSRWKEIVFS